MADPTTWQITGQATDQVINTPAGRTLVGVQVFFLTGDGNEGSVFMPNNLYNEKNVHAAIRKQATVLDRVGQMTEGTVP
jgi:hypothetical protein